MRKRIEAYIPKALEAIETLSISSKDGRVAKQFNGYISSFGASIRQAGLLATVIFYANANSNAEKEREKVVQAIEKIIGKSIQQNIKDKNLKSEVEDAAVALKLAIRTYDLV